MDIDIERPKIDCLSFVMYLLLVQLKTGFFSFFATAVYSTNEANKAGLKQFIFLDVYGHGAAHLKKCKQMFEYQHLLLLRDIWW
jgi:hypothetical protein